MSVVFLLLISVGAVATHKIFFPVKKKKNLICQCLNGNHCLVYAVLKGDATSQQCHIFLEMLGLYT